MYSVRKDKKSQYSFQYVVLNYCESTPLVAEVDWQMQSASSMYRDKQDQVQVNCTWILLVSVDVD